MLNKNQNNINSRSNLLKIKYFKRDYISLIFKLFTCSFIISSCVYLSGCKNDPNETTEVKTTEVDSVIPKLDLPLSQTSNHTSEAGFNGNTTIEPVFCNNCNFDTLEQCDDCFHSDAKQFSCKNCQIKFIVLPQILCEQIDTCNTCEKCGADLLCKIITQKTESEALIFSNGKLLNDGFVFFNLLAPNEIKTVHPNLPENDVTNLKPLYVEKPWFDTLNSQAIFSVACI